MELFKLTKEEKKSALITLLIAVVFVLILFFIRFTTTTSVALLSDGGGGGGGVTVNFGDSDFGSGDNYQSEILQVTEIKNAKSVPQQIIEETVLTQQAESTIDYVVTKKEKINKPKETKVSVEKVKTASHEVVKKQTVSKETDNALANLLGGNKGGDGDDNKAGNKGKSNGSLNSNNYYGSGSGNGTGTGNGSGSGSGTGSGSGSGYGSGSGSGIGSGSGYSLGNRKAISKPLPVYKCNETGKVVVEVSVDKTGKTLSATPGVRGTTNNARCLLDQAKIAAMNTKWESDTNAPEKQIGSIIYYFEVK